MRSQAYNDYVWPAIEVTDKIPGPLRQREINFKVDRPHRSNHYVPIDEKSFRLSSDKIVVAIKSPVIFTYIVLIPVRNDILYNIEEAVFKQLYKLDLFSECLANSIAESVADAVLCSPRIRPFTIFGRDTAYAVACLR